MPTLIFEDEILLALNKESGLPSEARKDQAQPTAESEAQMLASGPDALHLLHRLDTGTSGVLLFAKNKEAALQMRQLFKERRIQKFYRAFCHLPSGPLPSQVTVPLAHHPKSKKRMIPLPEGVHRKYRGKPLPAHTLILSQAHGIFEGTPCLEVSLQITTGVMHQIRVHLAHLGAPLLGDPLYNKNQTDALLPRLGLHAERIAFELEGHRYDIRSNLMKSI